MSDGLKYANDSKTPICCLGKPVTPHTYVYGYCHWDLLELWFFLLLQTKGLIYFYNQNTILYFTK